MLKKRGDRGRKTKGMERAHAHPVVDRPPGVPAHGPAAALPVPALPALEHPTTELGSLAEMLGEEAIARRGGVVCPCCQGLTPRVVRVRPGGTRRWLAVCAICAGRMLAGHPGTVVGGRVRPRFKRAG